jgi:DNA repair exonuclease SbcCD ATPase subunit
VRENTTKSKCINLTDAQKVSELEQETKRLREIVPENDVASLQEQLAAAKLREAEANLALKELRSKVAELSGMWQKHLRRRDPDHDMANGDAAMAVPSTPKKLLGSLLPDRTADVARLEEELMTARMNEVGIQAELKEERLKVMELETQVRGKRLALSFGLL